MFKSYETELAGRKLVIETGKICGLANGSGCTATFVSKFDSINHIRRRHN